MATPTSPCDLVGIEVLDVAFCMTLLGLARRMIKPKKFAHYISGIFSA